MNILVIKKRESFFKSEIGQRLRTQLEELAKDAAYNTQPGYSADREHYPDNIMPFVDKHMNYLYTHPALDPIQYLANLRLMTRKR
jgi:hypothetical protein